MKLKAKDSMAASSERDTKVIKTNDSWDWLTKHRETESLLVASQEQALNANSVPGRLSTIRADCVV